MCIRDSFEYHTLKLYPSAEESVRFLFISRIRAEKGIEEYLAAVETIRKETPKEFHIVGGCEGDYENENRLKRMRGCP